MTTANAEPNFRTDQSTGERLMKLLEAAEGWQYAGGHGCFVTGNGSIIWGESYGGPDGAWVNLDFMQQNGNHSVLICGLPRALKDWL